MKTLASRRADQPPARCQGRGGVCVAAVTSLAAFPPPSFQLAAVSKTLNAES